MKACAGLAALILAASVESLIIPNSGSFMKTPPACSVSGTNPFSVGRGKLREGLVILRLRGGAARDIPPLNSTEVELENNAQPDPNQPQHDQQLHHQSHSEAPPILPHDGHVVGDADQGYVQLPDDLRMPPGMQHMYQWEAPDGNQVRNPHAKFAFYTSLDSDKRAFSSAKWHIRQVEGHTYAVLCIFPKAMHNVNVQFIMDHTLGAQMPGGGMDQYNDGSYPQARIGDLLVRMLHL